MSNQDAYQRILASLSDAMLDDSHWPATSALIDEACGLTGNAVLVGEGPKDDMRVLTVGFYCRESATKSWSENTSKSTIPSTNECRACGDCPTVVWCTSPACTRPRS